MTPRERVGTHVAGRYTLQSVLARGGMGVLYQALQRDTGRLVALKIMTPGGQERSAVRMRFLNEARAAAAVRHPHIVEVLDLGFDEDESPFLAMELLHGRTLDAELKRHRQLSPRRTLSLVMPLIDAVCALHRQGVIHRDLKPGNIFLAQDEQGGVTPKLLDFGLARVAEDSRLTHTGLVVGTPAYMAPEHAAGEDVDQQADVWSLGVVLYECLSGRLPIEAPNRYAMATQLLAGRVVPLGQRAPHLPGPFVHAVERALRRDRSLRYRDVAQLVQGLQLAAREVGIAEGFWADNDSFGYRDTGLSPC